MYIPKNFYRTGGSKTYIPKNFFTKTTYLILTTVRKSSRVEPPRHFKAAPMSQYGLCFIIVGQTRKTNKISLK
ncbi:hypothetical protein Hanom_Chr15g01395271 [Helianthus anomalus]